MGSLSRARSVAVLGSTGSIGRQALEVIAGAPDRFTVHSLAANDAVDRMSEQIAAYGPPRVAMSDPAAAATLRERHPGVDVVDGARGIEELAGDDAADVVLNAVMGAVGLRATLAALDGGRHLALANKESCVAGGPLVARRLAAGATCVPVDSEHASVHMCLEGEDRAGVRRVVLTASGGPFRGRSRTDLEDVGVSDALAHPTWSMGAKITVDSATLMNKGLEVIEAHVLFALPLDAIDVICHPQSILHCLVGFADGAWKSALGPPDMRVPIAYALGHPERPLWGADDVDWTAHGPLAFEPIDRKTFRSIDLAYDAARTGGTAPAVLNAANEVAVEAFLAERLSFLAIADTVERVVDDGASAGIGYGEAGIELEDVVQADAWARERARRTVA